ncbi:MAG: DUF885 domain-containing protein [Opitutus sp.]|nr:DUF885 domain-containing protein [Opitutus sp.]
MTPALRLRQLLLSSLLVASTLCASDQPGAKSFDAWVGEFATQWTRGSARPAAATEASPDVEDADALFLEGQRVRDERQLALAQKGLAELAQWPAPQLDPAQRVSAALLRWHLLTFVERQPFTEHAFVFRQLRGLHVSLVDSLAERGTLRRQRDVDDYLERLGKVATRIDEGLARSRAATGRGLIPPRFILERSQQQLEMFLAPPAEENIFVTSLARRSAAITGLAPAARAAAVAKATRLVAEQVRPAYGRVRTYLAELMPRATDEAGISRMPEGGAAYAQALAAYTSTRLSADEIHAIGLREVARIEREMDGLLSGLGHTEGDLTQRLARAAAGTPLPSEPEPRAVLIARYTEIIRDAEKRSAALFNLKPRAPVEVRRVPALTEKTASAHYTSPPADGSRGGVFWVPLPGPTFALTPRMRSLAYHEAVPGHHFQLAIQQEVKELPRFRARRTFGGISAHSEGWALYVERLAVEDGWYEGDVPGRLGALSSELFRAKRLVVDTGLHTKGWTRQQAIAYGIPVSEVERYVVNPGQACSYMIGMLRILEVRDKAKAALGPAFSLPAFHDVVLRTGTVPLDLLGEVIDDWIANQRK